MGGTKRDIFSDSYQDKFYEKYKKAKKAFLTGIVERDRRLVMLDEHKRRRLVKKDGGRINSSGKNIEDVPFAYVRIPAEEFGFGKLLYQGNDAETSSSDSEE